MKPPTFLTQAGRLARKPRHGTPCNSCGLCCEATLCSLGAEMFHRWRGPCPALGYDDNEKSYCGLVREPQKFFPVRAAIAGARKLGEAARWLIGSGTGCDARFNGEYEDKAFQRDLLRWDKEHRKDVNKARKIWGV